MYWYVVLMTAETQTVLELHGGVSLGLLLIEEFDARIVLVCARPFVVPLARTLKKVVSEAPQRRIWLERQSSKRRQFD